MSAVTRPAQSQEQWLKCRIDKGMFSDERAVTYPAYGNTQKSVFVEASSVKGTPESVGQVLVRVIDRNGTRYAVLPSPDQDIVYFQDGDISG